MVVSIQPGEAGRSTVYNLFRTRAVHNPGAAAIYSSAGEWTYGKLLEDVDRIAAILRAYKVARGDRIAVLSENRPEYLMLQLAAAKIGASVACQNTRLADPELEYCINHVTPRLVFVSSRFESVMARIDRGDAIVIPIDALNRTQTSVDIDSSDDPHVDPEDILLLLYTSGTTGRPKAAQISHRAEIARMAVSRMDLGLTRDDAHIAWSPMSHIAATDPAIASMMTGSAVIIVDGFDAEIIADAVERHQLGWLFMAPGMIEQLADVIERRGVRKKGMKAVGCMLDLVPPALVARISGMLEASFVNSFGMTEAGFAPLSGGLVPPGVVPNDTSKQLSSMCELRLLDPQGNDVAEGETGEGAVRGPTLFSGYWNAPETNRADFATGFFRMGDLFRRTPQGTYVFVDRAKYMIKSGGENIYPAEIERAIMADPRVSDVAVVRRKDTKWGEVPVAFVARKSEDLTAADIEALCRRELAGFKRPKDVYFIAFEDLPRSTSGKILRHELEKKL